jgi:hypothetical protein
MKLIKFKYLKGYVFILTFENGETKETDLTSLLAKHVDENNLNTAQLNKDWGCLEFNDGAVDIEPKTLYRYATIEDNNSPITRSLLGVLAEPACLDEPNYKQHL